MASKKPEDNCIQVKSKAPHHAQGSWHHGGDSHIPTTSYESFKKSLKNKKSLRDLVPSLPPTLAAKCKSREAISCVDTVDQQHGMSKNFMNCLLLDIYSSVLEADRGKTPGKRTQKIRQRRGKTIAPGWLITLQDIQFHGLVDIDEAIHSISDPAHLIATLHTIINDKLQIPMSKEDICYVVNKVSASYRGFTFAKFMFAMANPNYARKVGIFRKDDTKFSCADVLDQQEPCEEDQERPSSNESGESAAAVGSKSKVKVTKSRKCTKSSLGKKQSNAPSPPPAPDQTGYTEREKVFYSGLLVLEMYGTLRKLETIYFNDWIPEPENKKKTNLNNKRGFGIENIGIKKLNWAEWDRPLPPVPKLSPYLESVPLVTSRWKITKPNQEERGKKRETARLLRMHLVVQPPAPAETTEDGKPPLEEPIRIMENKLRVKKVLEYLASQGDCVALLPNLHFMINLSDTYIDKLEEVTTNPIRGPISCEKYIEHYPSNEIQCIGLEARNLFRPFGLPKQIARLKYLISYTDGLHLRKITKHVEDQHWAQLTKEYDDFRERCWSWMHAGLIPPRLRPDFDLAFCTYLPPEPDLPIYHTHNSNSI